MQYLDIKKVSKGMPFFVIYKVVYPFNGVSISNKIEFSERALIVTSFPCLSAIPSRSSIRLFCTSNIPLMTNANIPLFLLVGLYADCEPLPKMPICVESPFWNDSKSLWNLLRTVKFACEIRKSFGNSISAGMVAEKVM